MKDINKTKAEFLKELTELKNESLLENCNEGNSKNTILYKILCENKNMSHAIIEESFEMIALLDMNNCYIYCNPKYSKVLGYNENELAGKNAFTFIHLNDRETALEIFNEALALKKADASKSIRLICKDGQIKWVEHRVSLLVDDEANSKNLLVMAQDITEEKLAREKLTKSEERYRRIADGLSDYLYTVKVKEGKAIATIHNDACYEITGYTPDEFENDQYLWINMIPPEERYIVAGKFINILEGNDQPPIEHQIICKNGEVRWVIDTTIPKYDSSGILISYDGVIKDITERKLAEAALKESEGKYRLLTENIKDVIWTMDTASLRFIYMSPSIKQLRGYTPEEVMNEQVEKAIIPEQRAYLRNLIDEKINAFLNEKLEKSEYFTEEIYQPCKDGSIIITEVVSQLWRNPQTGCIEIHGVTRDITERKQAEDQVKNLLKEKELILKEVHHRIKNNMSIIRNLLALQAENLKEPSAVAALRDAETRIYSMMVLYDKLYQSAEYNEISVKEYIPNLVFEIVNNFPKNCNIKIENEVEDYIIDAKKMSTIGIIINELITNILKYAFTGKTEGLIKIISSVKGNNVILKIQDNGNGLPESVDFENTEGFGLMLVGILTEQLDGKIHIERGEGTSIILEFEK